MWAECDGREALMRSVAQKLNLTDETRPRRQSPLVTVGYETHRIDVSVSFIHHMLWLWLFYAGIASTALMHC